jgi:hypothetical protein
VSGTTFFPSTIAKVFLLVNPIIPYAKLKEGKNLTNQTATAAPSLVANKFFFKIIVYMKLTLTQRTQRLL